MSSTSRMGWLVLVSIAGLLLFSAAFTVHQTQSALVFQLGKIVRAPISEPGLYWRIPFVQNVVFFDNRIQDLELQEQEVIAADQKRLVIDAFTRYRITDPLRFYQSVNNVTGANMRLASIVNSTVRTVLAEASFMAVVRTDRAKLMVKIREDANREAMGLGMEVIDVRLRRADLPAPNSQAVFQRMQTERQREAADIRANGSQVSQTIRARADRDVTVLRADAMRKSEESRGQGDAEKNRILAEAFTRDPDFFRFYRSMQAYEIALRPGETRMILNPDQEFFRYLRDPFARSNTNPAPAAKP
jgi:membrane protease subunit HflC